MKSKGIGCSELGDVWNLDYGCARRLFYKKREVPEDRPALDDKYEKAKERGKELEFLAIKTLEKKRGIVTRQNGGFLQSADVPLVGYVDRMAEDNTVVEAKCPGLYMWNKIKREGLSESYILQMHGYMYLKSAYKGIFAIFHPDPMDVLDPEVERDNKLIDRITEGVTELWGRITKGIEPDQLDMGDFRCKNCPWIDTCWGEKAMTIDGAKGSNDMEDMTNNQTLSSAVKDYKEASENIKMYTQIKDVAEEEIKMVLGERERAVCGESKIYCKVQSRVSWDLKKLEKDKPELKEQYKKESIFKTLKVY